MNRPTRDGRHGSYVTTPHAASMIQLLGPGATAESVAMSSDEWRAVQRLYGFTPEPPRQRPPPPEPPTRPDFAAEAAFKDAVRNHERWTDPRAFMQAGADRNAIRHAACDGLRMLAWIANLVPAGADPLKTLVQLAVDAGYDVDPADVEWAGEDEAEDER